MIKKYESIEELIWTLDENKKEIVLELMKNIEAESWLKPYINWHFILYKRKKTFVYINPYNKNVYVWFWNWKNLISKNPLISDLFDEIMWYNTKQYFKSLDEINSKYFKDLLKFAWNVFNKKI